MRYYDERSFEEIAKKLNKTATGVRQLVSRGIRRLSQTLKIAPPIEISEKIVEQVKADLNPKVLRIFGKLALIHAFMGSLSLFLCPQFGIAPSGNHGLMTFYMQLGPHICLAACGATFMIGSALLSSFLLQAEELRAVRRTKYLQLVGLGTVSMAVFLIFGEMLALTLILAWFSGMIVTGVATLELGFRVRVLQSR